MYVSSIVWRGRLMTCTSLRFIARRLQNSAWGPLVPQFGAEPVILAQRPLDAILDELAIERVDVVKLDIEGAEVGALQGLIRRLTSGGPPVIVFEFADWAETRIAGQTAGSAQEFLFSLGYSLFRLVRGGGPGERLKRVPSLPARP